MSKKFLKEKNGGDNFQRIVSRGFFEFNGKKRMISNDLFRKFQEFC